mmetsp:Transcript_42507/g.97392  ORF Transcript_42507/g.97392 Transcript_42507/m.97392 type:complete len:314 (+) Transcript_42507:96-1037(+)
MDLERITLHNLQYCQTGLEDVKEALDEDREFPQQLRENLKAQLSAVWYNRVERDCAQGVAPGYPRIEEPEGVPTRWVSVEFERSGARVLDGSRRPMTMWVQVGRHTRYRDLHEQIARATSRLPLAMQLHTLTTGMDGMRGDGEPVTSFEQFVGNDVSAVLAVLAAEQPLQVGRMVQPIAVTLETTLRPWRVTAAGRKAQAWLTENFLQNPYHPQLQQLLSYAEFQPIIDYLDRWISWVAAQDDPNRDMEIDPPSSLLHPTRSCSGEPSYSRAKKEEIFDQLLDGLTKAIARAGDDGQLTTKLKAVRKQIAEFA